MGKKIKYSEDLFDDSHDFSSPKDAVIFTIIAATIVYFLGFIGRIIGYFYEVQTINFFNIRSITENQTTITLAILVIVTTFIVGYNLYIGKSWARIFVLVLAALGILSFVVTYFTYLAQRNDRNALLDIYHSDADLNFTLLYVIRDVATIILLVVKPSNKWYSKQAKKQFETERAEWHN